MTRKTNLIEKIKIKWMRLTASKMASALRRLITGYGSCSAYTKTGSPAVPSKTVF